MNRNVLIIMCGLVLGLSGSAESQIIFKNSGQQELARITQNGQMGVGTTEVTGMLHIVSPSTGTPVLRLVGLGVSTTNIDLLTVDANGNVSKRTQSDWSDNDTQDLSVSSGGTNKALLNLTNGGSVAIGSSGAVQVAVGGTQITISAPTASNYWTLNASNNIYNNNSGGLVGIGQTAPRYSLDIAQKGVNNYSSIHVGKGLGDEGAFISSCFPHQFVISGGAAYVNNTGAEMTPKSAYAASVASYYGNIYLTTNLNPANPFTPTNRVVVGGKGHVFIGEAPAGTGYLGYQNDNDSRLNIWEPTGYSQLQFSTAFSETGGGFLTSQNVAHFAISGGTYYNGSSWYAVSTTPTIIASSSGYLNFFTDASAPAGNYTPSKRMTISPAGLVGIGVTAPRYQLDIAYTTANYNSSIHVAKGTADEGAYLSSGYAHQFVLSGGAAYNNNTGSTMTAKSDMAASVASYMGNVYLTADRDLTAGVTFTPSNRMVVGARGSVYIADIPEGTGYGGFQGVNDPKLTLANASGRSQLHFYKGWMATSGGYLTSGHSSQFAISGGAHHTGTTWSADDGNPSVIASYNGDIYFYTDQGKTVGNTFTPTQRMKITSAGYVGIGNSSPGYLLQVGTGGAWCDGTSWHDGSSRAFKNSVAELSLDSAMETLQALQPVTYRYNHADGDLRVGFIAEDVPELVADKERKSLSPMDITAVVTKVVQQQQQAIEQLREENRSLRQRLTKLEARL